MQLYIQLKDDILLPNKFENLKIPNFTNSH